MISDIHSGLMWPFIFFLSHNISIYGNFYQNQFINECTRKNLAERASYDLPRPLRSYFILWKNCIFIMLAFIISFDYITFSTEKISKKKWIHKHKRTLCCLHWPVRPYITLTKICVFIMLAFIYCFDNIRF